MRWIDIDLSTRKISHEVEDLLVQVRTLADRIPEIQERDGLDALFAPRRAVEERRLEKHVRDWVRVLEALRDDRLDLRAVQAQARLNANLDAIIREAD